MTTPDPGREAFGRHVRTENGIFVRGQGWLNRDEMGAYTHPEIQARWLTWQAAMAHSDLKSDWGGAQNTPESVRSLMDASPEVVHNNGWQPIETAPKDQLVMVYTPPTIHDYPDSVNIRFDHIDSDIADDYWYEHGEHYEHYCCVAKPEGSIGPSEKAPYTHWMPLPAAPKQEGST
ncbi:MAG: hypothetical protein [Caudoviricetes sp.]|nr:MAG: hypothetical protein [Caudoviricetes sp.]